jgi:GNAT superfamily N-acetyltransferase
VSEPGAPPGRVAEWSGAVEVVVSAFASDPVERWLYPDDGLYAASFPGLVGALGAASLPAQTAWCSPDGGAVALWLPPDVSPDAEELVEHLTTTVAVEQHADMFDALEQMAARHPSEPHWYLAWLAVEPHQQGRGAGGQLLTQCLAWISATVLPSYLETPNPRTITFYERHGFHVTGQTDAGRCPPITFMTRPAALSVDQPAPNAAWTSPSPVMRASTRRPGATGTIGPSAPESTT